MITVVGHILQKEHIFGLWRGMTPVSVDPLIAIVTFPLFRICGFYVEIPESAFLNSIYMLCGLGSSVGIVTDYGLDSPGLNPGGDKIFCPSRPALGPTQPPVKWVVGLSRGKVWLGLAADHSLPSSATVT